MKHEQGTKLHLAGTDRLPIHRKTICGIWVPPDRIIDRRGFVRLLGVKQCTRCRHIYERREAPSCVGVTHALRARANTTRDDPLGPQTRYEDF